MLWAYLDDSGIHTSEGKLERLVLAGGIAPLASWEENAAEWNKILRRFRISCFHMADFEARVAPFDKMSQTERMELLNSLLDVTLKYVPAFWGVVNLPSPNLPTESYKSAFTSTVCKAVSELGVFSSKVSVPITIVLARSSQMSCQLLGGYMDMLCDGKRVEPGGFERPETICALQVADLVAYEFSRAVRRNKPKAERYPLRRLKSATCALANAKTLRYEDL